MPKLRSQAIIDDIPISRLWVGVNEPFFSNDDGITAEEKSMCSFPSSLPVICENRFHY